MAAAIPAAIGAGSSIFGAASGKKAQKKQQKMAEEQMRLLRPLIDAQIQAGQFGLGQAQALYPVAESMFGEVFANSRKGFNQGLTDYQQLLSDAVGRSNRLYDQGEGLLGGSQQYLQGAARGLNDLENFYRPFMFDGQSAIDRFLPSKSRTEQLLAPEMDELNQGFQSASENIERFAPRGGGRVSSLTKGRMDLGANQANLFFGGRERLLDRNLQNAFTAAQGETSRLQELRALGLGQGQLGLGALGAGAQVLGTGGGLAMNSFGNALNSLGLGIGAGQGIGNLASGALGAVTGGGANATSLYNSQANRAYGMLPQSGSAKGLGGYLTDLFQTDPVQKGLSSVWDKIFGKKNNILPGTDFNYDYFG